MLLMMQRTFIKLIKSSKTITSFSLKFYYTFRKTWVSEKCLHYKEMHFWGWVPNATLTSCNKNNFTIKASIEDIVSKNIFYYIIHYYYHLQNRFKFSIKNSSNNFDTPFKERFGDKDCTAKPIQLGKLYKDSQNI